MTMELQPFIVCGKAPAIFVDPVKLTHPHSYHDMKEIVAPRSYLPKGGHALYSNPEHRTMGRIGASDYEPKTYGRDGKGFKILPLPGASDIKDGPSTFPRRKKKTGKKKQGPILEQLDLNAGKKKRGKIKFQDNTKVVVPKSKARDGIQITCPRCGFQWVRLKSDADKDCCPKCQTKLKKNRGGKKSNASDAGESQSGVCPKDPKKGPHQWKFGKCSRCGASEGEAVKRKQKPKQPQGDAPAASRGRAAKQPVPQGKAKGGLNKVTLLEPVKGKKGGKGDRGPEPAAKKEGKGKPAPPTANKPAAASNRKAGVVKGKGKGAVAGELSVQEQQALMKHLQEQQAALAQIMATQQHLLNHHAQMQPVQENQHMQVQQLLHQQQQLMASHNQQAQLQQQLLQFQQYQMQQQQMAASGAALAAAAQPAQVGDTAPAPGT
mmetsp:Transcript_2981/g.5620  ORF Transcript_2981/g.5620 Transcript_2981/m.5620 type:complete len:435 (+) Transcript_2981:241-1545(+)